MSFGVRRLFPPSFISLPYQLDPLCVYDKSLQSWLTLCDPMDCSLPGSSVHGILQARILEWVAMSSSRRSSWPRDQTQVSCLLHWQAGSLPLVPSGKPQMDPTNTHFGLDFTCYYGISLGLDINHSTTILQTCLFSSTILSKLASLPLKLRKWNQSPHTESPSFIFLDGITV